MEIVQERYVRYSLVALYPAVDFVVVSEAKLREGCPKQYPVLQGLGETIILVDPNAREFIQIDKDRCQFRSDKPDTVQPELAQAVLSHLLSRLGASPTAVGANYHYHFKLSGAAVGVIQTLLTARTELLHSIAGEDMLACGVRFVYPMGHRRHDLRMEALVPPRPQEDLWCHLNIHLASGDIDALVSGYNDARSYLRQIVARTASAAV